MKTNEFNLFFINLLLNTKKNIHSFKDVKNLLLEYDSINTIFQFFKKNIRKEDIFEKMKSFLTKNKDKTKSFFIIYEAVSRIEVNNEI